MWCTILLHLLNFRLFGRWSQSVFILNVYLTILWLNVGRYIHMVNHICWFGRRGYIFSRNNIQFIRIEALRFAASLVSSWKSSPTNIGRSAMLNKANSLTESSNIDLFIWVISVEMKYLLDLCKHFSSVLISNYYI